MNQQRLEEIERDRTRIAQKMEWMRAALVELRDLVREKETRQERQNFISLRDIALTKRELMLRYSRGRRLTEAVFSILVRRSSSRKAFLSFSNMYHRP